MCSGSASPARMRRAAFWWQPRAAGELNPLVVVDVTDGEDLVGRERRTGPDDVAIGEAIEEGVVQTVATVVAQDRETPRVLPCVRYVGVFDGAGWQAVPEHGVAHGGAEAIGMQLGAQEGGDHVVLGEALDLAHGGDYRCRARGEVTGESGTVTAREAG